MTTSFITAAGIKGRTGSSRRYIVVAERKNGTLQILYRTDDIGRANAYVRRYDGWTKEVIDLRPVRP